MLKKLKLIFVSLILTMGLTNTVSAQSNWEFVLGVAYRAFWDTNYYTCPFGSCEDWKIHIVDPGPNRGVYEDNSRYTETGYYGFEPTFSDPYNRIFLQPWSDVHKKTCADSSAYKEMSILGTPDGYTNFASLSGNVKTMKSFKVNQGVPFNFSAKRHGSLTRWLRDTFYFWSFGDGIRYLNKKEQVNDVGHSWKQLGKYTLSSLVYTEDKILGFSIGIDVDGDFGYIDSGWGFINETGPLYLEGCDVAEIEVVPNNPPSANFSYHTTNQALATTSIRFDSHSSDPDGNPLTNTWRYGSQTKTTKSANFTFTTPHYTTRKYTVSLTVSDGDMSDTTTKTVYVAPYCYACNGRIEP